MTHVEGQIKKYEEELSSLEEEMKFVQDILEELYATQDLIRDDKT